jgi:hypothetical protein
MGEKAVVKERKEIIFTDYLDKALDLPLVCCLAIADEKTVEVLNDKKKVITIFESYIKGGFDYLYDRIMAGPDKIQNYAYYLLKEHISD